MFRSASVIRRNFLWLLPKKKPFEILQEEKIDLVVVMLSSEEMDNFSLAEKIKVKNPSIPIVVLTPFSREVTLKMNDASKSVIDYVFSWLGNADLLLAIIKLIEDKMNVDHDIQEVGVQAILLVEDSIRFYSSYLPNMYKIIFKQSKDFMTEGLNEHQMMLRMRGRPKILLATTYEEALGLYEKYKRNLLGIITDMSYPRNGQQEKYAGVKFSEKVQRDDPFMPILLQSSDKEGDELAKKLKVGFINKNSKTISVELKNFIREYFAFGDFVFIDPESGDEIARATDLKSLQELLFQVPDEALRYQLVRNKLSKWLRARALFPLAEMLVDITLDDFGDLDEVRRYLFDSIASFRISKSRGVIAQFRRERFDEYLTFTRIGEGSIGGKARGLAFLDMLIKRNRILEKWPGVYITIPRTVVLCTDIFDEFMEDNNLYEIALSDRSDEEILKEFVQARLPFRIHEDLYTLISYVRSPIAVRSSSLLEDSHYQPFAGIYSTYMVPYVIDNERIMMEMLSNAIKSVYVPVLPLPARHRRHLSDAGGGLHPGELVGTVGDREEPVAAHHRLDLLDPLAADLLPPGDEEDLLRDRVEPEVPRDGEAVVLFLGGAAGGEELPANDGHLVLREVDFGECGAHDRFSFLVFDV